MVKKKDLNDYRENKYNRDFRKVEGEFVFDMDQGHFSINQIHKLFSKSQGKEYPKQRLYYLIRTGQLKAFRKGHALVIKQEDAQAFWDKETQKHRMKHG
jgi:hypothetical protein